MSADRIADSFQNLRERGLGGFVAFITAGDPDYQTSLEILRGLPGAGADIIELGMPFSDPMADGVAIQAASLRALQGGQTLVKTLSMVRDFRQSNTTTPLVLMGYYNPIYSYGAEKFLDDAIGAGVDGLIIVDLPPEEDQELAIPARQKGLHFIRLLAPTSTDERIGRVCEHATGFVYYVSVRGITGTQSADIAEVKNNLVRIKQQVDLPIAVGFGLRSAESVRQIAELTEAAVVGSAIVQTIADNLPGHRAGLPQLVLDYVYSLTDKLHSRPQ